MGGVQVSGKGGGRSVNSDINMVPFIDLLLVTISFLLITAVWVNHSRVEATAQLPGPPDGEIHITTPEPTLHVFTHESRFVLAWKQGATTISETELPRVVPKDGGPVDHHQLAAKIGEEFKRHGRHQDPSDARPNRALVHTENQLPFRELVAVMDAIHATKRPVRNRQGELKQVPAFGIGLSAR